MAWSTCFEAIHKPSTSTSPSDHRISISTFLVMRKAPQDSGLGQVLFTMNFDYENESDIWWSVLGDLH